MRPCGLEVASKVVGHEPPMQGCGITRDVSRTVIQGNLLLMGGFVFGNFCCITVVMSHSPAGPYVNGSAREALIADCTKLAGQQSARRNGVRGRGGRKSVRRGNKKRMFEAEGDHEVNEVKGKHIPRTRSLEVRQADAAASSLLAPDAIQAAPWR